MPTDDVLAHRSPDTPDLLASLAGPAQPDEIDGLTPTMSTVDEPGSRHEHFVAPTPERPFVIVYRSGQSAEKRSPIFPVPFATARDAREGLYRAYPGADARWPNLDIRETLF